ncbi:hypothetical protein AURDEDRAFT_115566 [Auricularia subglabra TFB-10046 SS5]|nr:hypothetical protein AURDEDRAFT_115566 [Auricularia subglabra TFB-10046 SS5]
MSCRPAPQWPLVLNWRQAVEHANAEHDALPELEWARWPPSTAERAVISDGSVTAWVCLKCPSSRQGTLSRPAVRHHLSEVHEIAQPVEGTHFARCTRTRWPPAPQSVLALHVEDVPCTVLDDEADGAPQEVLWKCQHCAAAAGVLFEGPNALERLERHLRDQHHVSLVPEQAQRPQQVEKQPVQQALPTPIEVAAMLQASPFLAFPAKVYPPPTQPFPAPAPAPAPLPTKVQPVAPAQPVPPLVKPVQPIPSFVPPKPVVNTVPMKERFRVATGGFVYLANTNEEKVYRCGPCGRTTDTKAADRRFSLNGIKMHLASKCVFPLWSPVISLSPFFSILGSTSTLLLLGLTLLLHGPRLLLCEPKALLYWPPVR